MQEENMLTVSDYCKQISEQLIACGEGEKAGVFLQLATEYQTRKKNDVLMRIKRMFGGMGSFNDLVLYNNGQVAVAENDLLSTLREELFDLVSKEIMTFRRMQ